MSAALQLPTPITEPDPPPPDRALPAAIGRVLGVVRELIDYGRQLAATLQQRAAAPGFALFAKPFGTTDVAVILRPHHQWPASRRGTGSLALPARRTWQGRAAAARSPAHLRCGRVVGCPVRTPGPPTPPRTRASCACSRRRKSPPRCVAGPSVPSSPTSAAISASCRPIRCGVKLRTVVIHYGGDLAKLWKDILRRVHPLYAVDRPPAAPEQSLPSSAPAATGPP